MLDRDDVYDGYFIPKGSIILANAWAMLRNEDEYGPDPDAFNPERFLNDGQLNMDIRDPSNMAFGFGRRYVCAAKPGRYCFVNFIL